MSHGCCNDFTRAQLLRGAAAEAGRGLPAIEPGMPEPAGTGLTRRKFISRSAGLALAVYVGFWFASLYAVVMVLSVAYSHPRFRWKAKPLGSLSFVLGS